MQYIFGHAPFMGLEFDVEPGVLIPRPETEVLVDVATRFLREGASSSPTIVDLCTGCGCVAISLAREFPSSKVYATDISEKAIHVANNNTAKYSVDKRIDYQLGDLEEPITKNNPELIGKIDLIVSNPPYVPSNVMIKLPTEVQNYEPKIALNGGNDGLDFFYRIADFSKIGLRKGGMLAVELFETKLDTAYQYLKNLKYNYITIHDDLAKKPRIITASNIY